VGSSPETVVKCEGKRASLNPIAGSIKPGEGDKQALLSSEKDKAEHVMLVDLGRNDLSRVCRPGSVRVERFMRPERFSHITHLISEVVGELEPEATPFDLLRACFPAGTVSGVPRCGRCRSSRVGGLIGAAPTPARSAITTRRRAPSTPASRSVRWALKDGVAYLQAGAGLVADSDPTAEHEECLNKLAAVEAAIELAEAER